MKRTMISKIYRVMIFAVPLLVIGALIYSKVLQLQTDSSEGTHIVINEVVADNLSTLKDENGVYADWIELYNPTEQEINLNGYYLSDTNNELTKWAFPDISIAGDGYLVVFCDGSREEGTLHANFFINADKETIYLSDENENIIDSIRLEKQQCDISYGRMFGNTNKMGFLPYCTPLEPNPAYFTQNKEIEADWGEVRFSLEGGLYNENIQVELSCDVEGAAILYTLDGSEPDIGSFVYKDPIEISDQARPNQYTTKKCIVTPSDNADNADTLYGVNTVYKGTVIRARILKDAKFSTSIQTNTYFINAHYSMPIVSITSDPDMLFDDSEGEYVLGYTYYTMKKYGKSTKQINSYRKKELTGHIEIYDTDGSVFADDMTFSIAGASSVRSSLQKSFNVILNNKKVSGDMFGASDELNYERFSLRGPGNGVIKENTYAYPSAFVSNYISSEGVGGQSNRFYILFIDGEYWGIYSLMEPKGKEYMHESAGVSKKDITMVIPWKNVFDREFDELFEEIKDKDFRQKESYEWIKTKIDIDNFMETVFVEAFFGNTDGISDGDHNLYVWKEKGGMWKWQIFDFDSTMVDNENYFKDMIDLDFGNREEEERKNFTSWLFQRLWQSETFRKEFTEYVIIQCNGRYNRESVTTAFEEHVRLLEEEMQENLLRCEKGYTKLKQFSFKIRGIDAEYQNYTMNDWEVTVNDMRRFLTNRTERVLEFLYELENTQVYNA